MHGAIDFFFRIPFFGVAGGEMKPCFILAKVQLCNPGRGRGGENEGGKGAPWLRREPRRSRNC